MVCIEWIVSHLANYVRLALVLGIGWRWSPLGRDGHRRGMANMQQLVRVVLVLHIHT